MSSFIGQSPMGAIPATNDGLSSLWRNVARHKLLFAAIVGACCVAGGVYVLVTTPQYRADALLRVQIKPGASISALSDVSGTTSADQSADDEADVLSSRTIVGEAIAATGADTIVETGSHFPLIGNYVASRHVVKNTLARPLFGLNGFAWGGEQLKTSTFTVPPAALGQKFEVVAGQDGNYTLLDKNGQELVQGHVGQTANFTVSTDDGAGAGQLNIAVLRARPGIKFELSKVSTETAYENVSAKLKTSVSGQASSLRDSSMMRISYQAASPAAAQTMVNAIVNAFVKRNVDDRAAQARMKLDTLNTRLPALKAELEKAEDRLNTFRMQNHAIDMEQQGTMLISRMNALTDKQASLRLEFDEKRQLFGPDSPIYKGLVQQLDQVNSEIAQTGDLAKNLPNTQREYIRLASDVSVSRQLYTGVLSNAQQLEVAAASTASGVNVLDWAVAPEKAAWPRKAIVLLASLLGGLFAATAAVHFTSLNRRELRTPQEIAHVSNLPRLAVVAHSKSQLRSLADARKHQDQPTRLLAVSSPLDPSVEALRALPSSVRAMLADDGVEFGHKVILFTGPTQGVGKSFVSSNFAYLLSRTEESVLLIDGDMRKGTLGRLRTDQEGPGLAEVLRGTAPLDKAIVKQAGTNLSVLAAGDAYPSNPGELLRSATFGELLATLREYYDYIVIDSPPVLPVSDAVTIAAQGCDLVLVVSRADHTGSRQLEETLQRLANVGAKVGGHIFNGFLPSRYGERGDYGLDAARRY